MEFEVAICSALIGFRLDVFSELFNTGDTDESESEVLTVGASETGAEYSTRGPSADEHD